MSIRSSRVLWMFAVALAVIAVTVCAGISGAEADTVWESREQPALVLTGSALVSLPATVDGEQEAAVIAALSQEKAYSLAELKALPQTERVFSTLNSSGYRKQYLASGVDVAALLKLSGFDPAAAPETTLKFASGPSFAKTFEGYGALKFYRYPAQAAGSEADKAEVGSLIVLSSVMGKDNSDAVPAKAEMQAQDKPSVAFGMRDFSDMNQSGFVKDLDTLIVGDALTANTVNIFGTAYSRAQLLAMERVTATYTYITKKGEFADTVRGIALADLTADLAETDMISISYADGYAPTELQVADIRNEANRYMLALEKKNGDKWEAVFSVKNGYAGIGAVYSGAAGVVEASGPASMIAGINKAGDDFAGSKYKHVTYAGTTEGATYAPDAITGATLTVEGPGVAATTPIMVGDLERTASANLYRGEYTDKRGGKDITLVYEGATVQSIIEGQINNLVDTITDDITVIFKNRWRQDVAAIPYSMIKAAKTPLLMAYGTGTADGSMIAPFIYNNEPGLIEALGNDDGGLKLVYDAADFSGIKLPEKFGSVAYIYVELSAEAPGYKHSEASDPAYSNVGNSQYIITLLGDALGREVNLTVEELESMVSYNAKGEPIGLGYRASYGLSNTTYWYVNTYEGVKLWDLLVKLGVPADKYKNDDQTLVTFSSWDNYKTTAAFSMKQLADPDQFYFYEKSPIDIGADRPSKEQLANKEYQPDNQVGVWEKDANGYPVLRGYPVMIAYGVNGYPYVRNANMEGYYGGLGNDGGPVRVIFGKADGMSRDNPEDITNYAYFYNNGSNQMQRAQEIFVGAEVRYSTHYQNPAAEYQELAGAALTVEVVQANGDIESKKFTVKQLQELVYEVEKRDRDNDNRVEKAYYQYQAGKDALFEGVNLWYLLSEAVGMQGSLGSVAFYSGETKAAEIALDALKLSGGNSLRGTSGLEAMLAYARNGYPLVADAKAAGYVAKDKMSGIAVENAGGPLAFVAPQFDGGAVTANNYAGNIDKIVVNLEADKYAHTDAFAALGEQTVSFSGAIGREGSLKISDIEKLQKYMVTGDYTVAGKTARYRGVDLQQLLNDRSVSATALMETVTVTGANGASKSISATELANGVNGKRVILAYGVGVDATDINSGIPLVAGTSATGYDAARGNSGGPLRLIIEGGSDADCVAGVSAIHVEAAVVTGWNHTYGYYKEYLNTPVLRITGDGVAQPVTFTVGQLESLVNEKVVDIYKMKNDVWVQGVDLYKLLMDHVELKEPGVAPNFTAYAKDAFATTFKGSDLANGVNGKPIILAFGHGVAQDDGLPLVDGDDSAAALDGFDPEYGNAFGPIRMVVHDNSGWCVKWLRCIVIGTGSFEDPEAFAGDLADIVVTVGEGGASAPAAKPAAKPEAPKPVVSAPAGSYVVQPGDNLSRIAMTQLGDKLRWYEIYQANRSIISDPTYVYPGQVLVIPK